MYKFLFIIFTIWVTPIFALDYNDSLKVKVLSYLKDSKTLLIDRGRSDFVEPREHIKLYEGDRFVARAYSLEIGLYASIWMVYFIQHEIPLIDYGTLIADRMPHRFVPRVIRNAANNANVGNLKIFLKEKMTKDHKDINAKLKYTFKESQLQDEEKISVLDSNDEISVNPDIMIDEIISQGEEADKLYNVSLRASPIQFESRDSAKEFGYSFELDSIDWDKKQLKLFYQYNSKERRPTQFGPANSYIVRSSQYFAGAEYEYSNFYKDLSIESSATFERQRDGEIYPIRSRVQIAPLGLKYDIYESSTLKEFSISYAPTYEVQVRDGYVNNSNDECCVIEELTYKRLRHAFRLKLLWQPQRSLTVSQMFLFRPAHDLSNKDVDFEDDQLRSHFRLSYGISDSFSISYENLYTHDILLKRLQNISSSNMIHTINFGYNFNL